jgi:translation initiation factor IF-1
MDKRNHSGGSAYKKFARKSFAGSKPSNKTRLAIEEEECYAQVVACLGNNMLHVMCIDGIKRLCIIRGIFRGKSRRDNNAKNGSWVLVGLRGYVSISMKNKMEHCDLLEVYSDIDKERLKDMNPSLFYKFVQYDNTMYGNGEEKQGEDNFKFTNEEEDEYDNLMLPNNNAKATTNTTTCIDDEEEFDENYDFDNI